MKTAHSSLLILAAMALAAVSAGCQLGTPDPQTQIASEYAASNAALAKGDFNTAFANYAPDFVLANSHGSRHMTIAEDVSAAQASYAQMQASGETMTSNVTITNFQLQPGGNAAVVTTRVGGVLTRGGVARKYHVLFPFRDYWIKSPDGKTWLLKQEKLLISEPVASGK